MKTAIMLRWAVVAAVVVVVGVVVGGSGCGKKPETPDTPSITYDTLTDDRDGKKYKTVKMPDGKTWMAENLNYKIQDDSSFDYHYKEYSWMAKILVWSTATSRCYRDSSLYCDKYGRLYNWFAAKTVCPAGWHLPTRQEWDSLNQAVGGERHPVKRSSVDLEEVYWDSADTKLKARSGWVKDNGYVDDYISGNGTDEFGFSALPGGYCYPSGESEYVGRTGIWWAATTKECDNFLCDGYIYQLDAYNRNGPNAGIWKVVLFDGDWRRMGYSVRCVMDND